MKQKTIVILVLFFVLLSVAGQARTIIRGAGENGPMDDDSLGPTDRPAGQRQQDGSGRLGVVKRRAFEGALVHSVNTQAGSNEPLAPRLNQKISELDGDDLERLAVGTSGPSGLQRLITSLDQEKLQRIAQNRVLAYKVSQLGEEELKKLSGLSVENFEKVIQKVPLVPPAGVFEERQKLVRDKKIVAEKKALALTHMAAPAMVAQAIENSGEDEKENLKEYYKEKTIESLVSRLDYLAELLKQKYPDSEKAPQAAEYLQRVAQVQRTLLESPTREAVKQAKDLIKEFFERFFEGMKEKRNELVLEKTQKALDNLLRLHTKASEVIQKIKAKYPNSGLVNAFEVRQASLWEKLDELKGKLSEIKASEPVNQREALKLAHATAVLGMRYHNFLRVLSKFYHKLEVRKQPIGEVEPEVSEELDDQVPLDMPTVESLLEDAQEKIVEQESIQTQELEEITAEAVEEEQQKIDELPQVNAQT